MVRASGELSAIPPFPALEEPRHARDGRRAGARFLRDVAVGLSTGNQLCHLPPLAPGLQLRERPDVTEEICDVCRRVARCQCNAEAAEPRVPAPGAFGEASTCHADIVIDCAEVVNVLSH